MARRKNTKRIDPRWFMDEKTDTINEASIKRKSRPSDTIPEPEPTDNVMMNIALANDYYEKTGKTVSWDKEGLEDRNKRIAAARANAGKYGSVSKHLEEDQGGGDMAQAEELAQALSQSPAVMAAVEQAAQNPEVQAKAAELSQKIQEDIKTDRAEFYAAAGGGIGTAGQSVLMGQMLGISAAKAVPSVAALGLTAAGTGLLTVAIGILIYNALQDRVGRSDTQI